MAKQTISSYVFNPGAGTVLLPGYVALANKGTLLLIANATRSVDVYLYDDATKAATITTTSAGTLVTLTYNTSSHNANDDLLIVYDDGNTPIQVGNARKKFRDGFASPFVSGVPDPAIWTLSNTDGHLISQGGNSSGSSYLNIGLNPLFDDSEVTFVSKETFRLPMRVGFGLSMSQRIAGQEAFIGMVDDDGTGNANFGTTVISDFSLASATVTVTTNVATVTLSAGAYPVHPFTGGDRISVYGFNDSRMNVGPVVVTALTATTFSFPVTIANGTYTSTSAYIRYADPLRWAYNGAGHLFGDNQTVTNGSYYSRRNGARYRGTLNQTVTTTTATQTNVNPYTDAFNSAANYEQEMRLEEVDFRSFAADSLATNNGSFKFTQGVPDESPDYHIYIRARNLKGMTKPVARITAISKTGTTTATVTTDVPHGLTTSDFVQIYGVLNQAATAFPNLAAATAVASVIDSTHFTIIIGTAATVSSSGGAVYRNQGSVLAPGAYANAVQSIVQLNGIVTVTGSATWATPLPGEHVFLYGLSDTSKEGFYKVLRVSTTTLELQAQSGVSDFTIINTGGVAIKVTDVRLHFTRLLDYSRLVTEVVGGRGVADQNNSVPVYIAGGSPGTTAVSQTTGVNTTTWNAAGFAGFLVNDIVSAALTATATSAAITPGIVANLGVHSNQFNVVVTAVSGTAPTLDVQVQESPDNGTNWLPIYDFPRITAIGSYNSPQLPNKYGTRYRYVRTVGGTTPSFTTALNRNQYSVQAPYWRQFIDRTSLNTGGTIVLTTLNSATAAYYCEGAKDFQLVVSLAAATTPPQIQLQGSDDNGTTWYNLGSPLTGVASSAVALSVVDVPTRHVRALVSSAGATITAANNVFVLIKALGR